ncbi:MAG: hypothetical protein LBQ88_07185, partial [Treponema sp.]|nr:hypothetical protein [Treponema sp.]
KEGGKTRQLNYRAFENASDEEEGSVYIPTRKALEDPEYRDCILESIRRGIRELSEKGRNYAAIINSSAAYQKGLDDALRALESERAGLEEAGAN